MVDKAAQGANFVDLEGSQRGHAHIFELGINAIELLPPADSLVDREWGYGTSHMFAPDYELGYPEGNSWPTANADFRRLVETCHARHIRIIVERCWLSREANRTGTSILTISTLRSIRQIRPTIRTLSRPVDPPFRSSLAKDSSRRYSSS
jgi:hypothetical protein